MNISFLTPVVVVGNGSVDAVRDEGPQGQNSDQAVQAPRGAGFLPQRQHRSHRRGQRQWQCCSRTHCLHSYHRGLADVLPALRLGVSGQLRLAVDLPLFSAVHRFPRSAGESARHYRRLVADLLLEDAALWRDGVGRNLLACVGRLCGAAGGKRDDKCPRGGPIHSRVGRIAYSGQVRLM